MSSRLEQVKLLLRGIRTDNERYQQLRALLEEQRLCMIRRACDALMAVNAQINLLYPALSISARTRRETLLSLGVTPDAVGIGQVFSWLPLVQKVAARQAWQQLMERTEACKRLNDKNGQLLTWQYDFVQAFLGIEPELIYRP